MPDTVCRQRCHIGDLKADKISLPLWGPGNGRHLALPTRVATRLLAVRSWGDKKPACASTQTKWSQTLEIKFENRQSRSGWKCSSPVKAKHSQRQVLLAMATNQLLTSRHCPPDLSFPDVTVSGIKWDEKAPAGNFSAVYGNILYIKGVDVLQYKLYEHRVIGNESYLSSCHSFP